MEEMNSEQFRYMNLQEFTNVPEQKVLTKLVRKTTIELGLQTALSISHHRSFKPFFHLELKTATKIQI